MNKLKETGLFKPLSTRKVSSSKNAAEEDEPTNIICGIENMFAGIHEDQSDGRWETHTIKGIFRYHWMEY